MKSNNDMRIMKMDCANCEKIAEGCEVSCPYLLPRECSYCKEMCDGCEDTCMYPIPEGSMDISERAATRRNNQAHRIKDCVKAEIQMKKQYRKFDEAKKDIDKREAFSKARKAERKVARQA